MSHTGLQKLGLNFAEGDEGRRLKELHFHVRGFLLKMRSNVIAICRDRTTRVLRQNLYRNESLTCIFVLLLRITAIVVGRISVNFTGDGELVVSPTAEGITESFRGIVQVSRVNELR